MLKSIPTAVAQLVAIHVVAGIALASVFSEGEKFGPAAVAFVGVIFAQAGLSGIGAGLGTSSIAVRWFRAGLGLLLPCALACCALRNERSILCGLLATNMLVVAGVLSALRGRGTALRRTGADDAQNRDEPLRFGIRHLMAWILATAVLLKIGQTLDRNGTLGILFSYGLTFATVSVAAPWAALGRGVPALRAAALVLAAGLLGMAGPLYSQRGAVEKVWFFGWGAACDALVLLASLGWLRRTGLRLVKVKKTPDEPAT